MTLTGGYDINSLLKVQTGSVEDYGYDRIVEIIQRETEVHNELTADMLATLTERTTERLSAWGAGLRGEMIEVDEYGRAPTQNQGTPGEVALPLRKYQYNLGWTNDWMLQATPADLARAFQAATSRDVLNIRRLLREAVFTSSNATVRDVFVDNVELTIRRFVNGDGSPIPIGPNGDDFDPTTHTHYLTTRNANLDEANVTTLVQHVVEHGHSNGLSIYINQAQESTLRGFSGFAPYMDARIIPASGDTVARGALDVTRIDNRAIGIIDGAEVFVKPWIPAGYLFAFASADTDKPLGMRVHNAPAMQGLRLAATLPDYPLFADVMENYCGFGAWTRTNGAVMQITNSGTYSDPD